MEAQGSRLKVQSSGIQEILEPVHNHKEEEEEHNMVPETKLQIMELRDIAWCAKSKDIIHYFTAPSYQNTFPEVITANLFPEDYVKSASQLLVTSRIVLITTQRTTITGYASRAG